MFPLSISDKQKHNRMLITKANGIFVKLIYYVMDYMYFVPIIVYLKCNSRALFEIEFD